MPNEKTPDFWLGVWQPQISGAVEDQRPFEESSLPRLKSQLTAQCSVNRTDFFATAASATCANQLRTPDSQVCQACTRIRAIKLRILQLSFPLCAFVDFPTPPEPIQDAERFFDWIHDTVTFMRLIPAEQLREGLKFSESDAVFASIHATVMRHPKQQRIELWKSAYYRIVASLLMDNQESRSVGTIIKVRISTRTCSTALFYNTHRQLVDLPRRHGKHQWRT